MGWINLAFLMVGVGLGAGGAAIARFRTTAQDNLSPPPEPPAVDLEALQQEVSRTQQAYQMAQLMSQFKAGFLARTSHELRSPLNGAIGMHQLILSDLCDSPEEEREFLQQAHASILKMLGLLDEIITISKIEQGTRQIQIQPVFLAEIFADVKQLTYLQAANRNLRLEVQFPEPDLQVMADPQWLRQALLILVDTPIALMEEGRIRLSVQPDLDDPFVHIWIEDQRPAVTWQESLTLLQSLRTAEPQADPAAQRQRLADLAHAEDTESSLRPSMGLGLILAQSLMESLGGHLDLLATPLQFSAEANPSSQSGAEMADVTRIQCRIPKVQKGPSGT